MLGELMARVYQHFGGYVDQIGGVLATFIILITYNAALSIVGSMGGVFLSRKFTGDL